MSFRGLSAEAKLGTILAVRSGAAAREIPWAVGGWNRGAALAPSLLCRDSECGSRESDRAGSYEASFSVGFRCPVLRATEHREHLDRDREHLDRSS